MADFLKDELGNIAYVLCYGGLLACIYDIIKCIRHFIRHNIVAVSVEDMLFWFMASLFTLKLTIELNDGGLRLYLFIGMVLGAGIYYQTIHFILKKLFCLFTIKIKKRGGRTAKKRQKI